VGFEAVEHEGDLAGSLPAHLSQDTVRFKR
jgi:hypothetical protein